MIEKNKKTAFFILIIVLLLLFNVRIRLLQEITANASFNSPFREFKPVSYPKIISFLIPTVSAEAFLILDNDSQTVLLSKNADLRFSMASTTKIMTALVALDYFKMDDILTIKNDLVEGAQMGLVKEEKMTFEHLLYAMLLPSANDAALTIAQNYKGGEKELVKKMNEKAGFFHLINTHFSDPIGLDDNENYSTPLDLARLSAIALKNKIFAKVVSTKYKTISDTNGFYTYDLTNLNKLLGINGVNGVKTGFTEEAGEVLVASKTENKHSLITVVMKSNDRFGDTEKLLSSISSNIKYFQF